MKDFNELDKRTNALIEKLEHANLQPQRLTDKELKELFASYFDTSDLSNLITDIEYDSIRISERYNQLIAAVNYPNTVIDGWLEGLISGDSDLSIHIEPYDSAESLKLLNREIRKQETDIIAMEKKGQFIPRSLEIRINDNKDLLEDIQRGKERLFKVSIYVNTRAYTKKGLKELTDRIKSTFRSVMIEPEVARRMEDAIKSILPLASNKLNTTRTLTSSSLAACIPFLSPSLSVENTGINFGVNDVTGLPLIIDHFNLSNSNGTVIGMSGVGKSYSVKSLCIKDLMFPDRLTFILDREGEYLNLTKAYDGQIVKIGPESDTALNPFDMMDHTLVEKKLSLHTFMDVILQGVSEPQRAMLDDGFDEIYERKGIMDDPKTWSKKAPILDDLHSFTKRKQHSKRDPDGQRTAIAVSKKLKMFTEGSLNFMNKQTNVNLHNRLVTFDLRDVPKHVIQPVTYLILEYLINRMRDDLRRKTIIIDEGWSVLENPSVCEYLYDMARTGRKRNTSLIVITQQIDTFLRRKPDGIIPGKSIISNSSWKLVFWQDTSVLKDVIDVFNLNKREVQIISNRDEMGGKQKQGRGLLLVENVSIPIRVIVSPEEHKLITTKPDEMLNQGQESKPVEYEDTTYRTDREIIPLSELDEEQIKDLRKQGYHIARDPAFGKGRGSRYILKNDTQESDSHFILRNLIYDEIKKHTSKARSYQSAKPDVIFHALGYRKGIAIEIETGSGLKFNFNEFMEKLRKLEKEYDDFFFVVTKAKLRKTYEGYGKTLTRTEVLDELDRYFEHEQQAR